MSGIGPMLWVLFALILFFHMALEALDIRKAFLTEGMRLLSPTALDRFRLWNSKDVMRRSRTTRHETEGDRAAFICSPGVLDELTS